uniref:Uncharacterized protein n=1 Tax=Triticum urartu TaxID=4572 RepID=A0A8R7V7W6_TRIUA
DPLTLAYKRYLNPNLFQFLHPLAAAASSDRPCRRDARERQQTLTSDDGAPERHRPAQPAGGAREAQAQEEAPRAVPQLLLHGRQVPGLLQHHYCVQPLPDCGGVPWLPNSALPANGRQGQANRRLLLPPQGRLNIQRLSKKASRC